MMITYREAQESDLVKLLKMWKNFQDEQMNYFKKYSKFKENVIEITKDFFLETMNLKKGLIYLAIDNKKIIGFVLARVTDFYPPTMKWKKEGKGSLQKHEDHREKLCEFCGFMVSFRTILLVTTSAFVFDTPHTRPRTHDRVYALQNMPR